MMLTDPIFWTAVSGLVALCALQIAVIKWVASVSRANTLTETKATAADALGTAALAKTEILSSDFSNHREKVAASIAEARTIAEGATTAIAQAENRLAKAMDDFGDRLDQIAQRLDRILDHRVGA
jgi:DNA anti-recombination protein RmuC